jgi:hypothetical protein
MDRNTTISSRKDSPITAPMNHGSRSLMRWLRSMSIAVWPPTCAWAGEPARAAGSTVSLSRWTSASVAASWGALAGSTWITALSPPSDTTGSLTAAMPGSAISAARTASGAPSSPARSTATSSGPLKPGPKATASWS